MRRRTRMILLGLLLATSQAWQPGETAEAAPYYRFWRGFKLPTLSDLSFKKSLRDHFLPATVALGADHGLIGYLPFLSPLSSLRPPSSAKIGDEVALVVYESEADYRKIFGTEAGRRYGKLHWRYFERERGSASFVAEPYVGRLADRHAYDVLSSQADWRFGTSVMAVSRLEQNPRPYLERMISQMQAKGLISYVVLVADDHLYEYLLWDSEPSYESARVEWRKLAQDFLQPLIIAPLAARPATDSKIEFGHGISAQF